MGQLTTHVLDTMNGTPAAGMAVSLHRLEAEGPRLLRTVQLNDDGRVDRPLLEGDALQVGRYRLVFSVGSYFMSFGAALPSLPFLDDVPVDFGIADAQAHYHVPLLASPWSYCTYRGS